MRGYSMRKCAQLGCLAGGAVVQVVGAEMTPESWRWVFARSAHSHASACLHFLLPCISLSGLLGTQRTGSVDCMLAVAPWKQFHFQCNSVVQKISVSMQITW